MAIVVNKAGTGYFGFNVDQSYFTHKRTAAASPNGVLTPIMLGEVVFDTTNKVRWKSIGLAATEWIPIDAEVT